VLESPCVEDHVKMRVPSQFGGHALNGKEVNRDMNMTREQMIAEVNRKLALFRITRKPADYPAYLLQLLAR